jgi:hypothetical protein
MVTILDLRKRGIKAIEEEIEESGVATLSYRGHPKYVVLDIEEYEKLRELELMLAYQQVMEEVKRGKFEAVETPEELDLYLKQLAEEIKE